MQQIERYGVIALVFLLVTIVAISFWGDSKSPGFWSRLTGKGQPKPQEVAKLETPQLPTQIADPSLPLSPAPAAGPQVIDTLGGPQATTSIDTPAIGAASQMPPDAVVVTPPAQGIPPIAQPTMPIATPTHVVEAPAPVPTSAPSRAGGEYVVQRGDSLARIARQRLGAESRWQEIAALNPSIDPKSLNVGQKLMLPDGASPAPSAPKASAKPTTDTKAAVAKKATKPAPTVASAPKKSTGRACVVEKGDTLRSIARRELGDERRWKEIQSANPGLDPAKLAIGMRIKLPSKGADLIASAAPASSNSDKPRVR